MHWSDIVMETKRSRVTNIADKINARLNKIQIEYLNSQEQQRPNSVGAPFQSIKAASNMGSIQNAGMRSTQRFSIGGDPS